MNDTTDRALARTDQTPAGIVTTTARRFDIEQPADRVTDIQIYTDKNSTNIQVKMSITYKTIKTQNHETT